MLIFKNQPFRGCQGQRYDGESFARGDGHERLCHVLTLSQSEFRFAWLRLALSAPDRVEDSEFDVVVAAAATVPAKPLQEQAMTDAAAVIWR